MCSLHVNGLFPLQMPEKASHLKQGHSSFPASLSYFFFFAGILSNPAARRAKKLQLTGEKCTVETSGLPSLLVTAKETTLLSIGDNIA